MKMCRLAPHKTTTGIIAYSPAPSLAVLGSFSKFLNLGNYLIVIYPWNLLLKHDRWNGKNRRRCQTPQIEWCEGKEKSSDTQIKPTITSCCLRSLLRISRDTANM